MGRFINADALVSTGQGFLGNNMFAYCGNNPVHYSDPTGHVYSGINNQINYNEYEHTYGGLRESSLGTYRNRFNLWEFITNEDESLVLQAEYLAFYKGHLVIRTNGTRSGSFGVLFITRETNSRRYAEDIVRHEYGHTKQLQQLGLVKYLSCIVIPSFFEWGSDSEYYRRPWEITADIYGQVQSRSYPGYEASGFEYLENSRKWGFFVWFTIE